MYSTEMQTRWLLRVIGGFVIVPPAVGLAGGLTASVLDGPRMFWSATAFATVVAVLPTGLFGFPAYIVFLQDAGRRRPLAYLKCGSVIGALVAAAPALGLLAAGQFLAGAVTTGYLMALGACGALLFWAFVRPDRDVPLSARSTLAHAVVAIAFLLPIGIKFLGAMAFPIDSKPKASLEIRIPLDQRGELRDVLKQFASDEGLTFDDAGPRYPEVKGRPMFYVVAKKGNMFEVLAISGHVDALHLEDHVSVFAYMPRPNAEFDALKTRLLEALKAKWPDLTERPVPQ